jgi:hypothetical protein
MGASAYTRERLEEAAREARTLSEALVRLGVDPKSPTRRYVHERMKKLGVDVSHFEREGVKWTRDVLEPAVAASTNMGEVLRHLGLEVVGGHHTHIRRRSRHMGSTRRTSRCRRDVGSPGVRGPRRPSSSSSRPTAPGVFRATASSGR